MASSSSSTTMFLYIGFVLICIAYLPKSESRVVDCYVCNHSPKDNRTEEWCTEDNFRPDVPQTINCDRGCEYVRSYDNNNVLEHVHRNCINANETAKDECYKIKNRNYIREVCVCTRNLCNNANIVNFTPWSLLLTWAIASTWWLRITG